jgi:hypothetical protein
VELTVLAPLLTVWLAGRLTPRFARLSDGAPPLAACLAVLLVVIVTYSAAALAGLR